VNTTFRSRCIIGVWQWCRRDTASHMSQNIRSTSRSVKPVEMRSFICAITEPTLDRTWNMAWHGMLNHFQHKSYQCCQLPAGTLNSDFHRINQQLVTTSDNAITNMTLQFFYSQEGHLERKTTCSKVHFLGPWSHSGEKGRLYNK